jgi:guanine nucleotide-binding protein subunit alpha
LSKGKEIVLHTSTNWKKAFALGSKSKSPKSAHTGEIEGWWEDPEDPVHSLNACAPTMQELWRDPQVRKRLQEKRLRLEESSGLYVACILFKIVYAQGIPSYLDEIPRITAKKYIPTDREFSSCGVIYVLIYVNA